MQYKQKLQTKLDIQLIYGKGRRILIMDQQRNRNMINILKHAEKLVDELESIPNKVGQVYSKYHRLFKILRAKAGTELELLREQSSQMGQTLKKSFNQVIDELAAKARRYEQGEKRIKQLGRMNIQSQQEGEQQQQRIKQEMLELMQAFKIHAKEIGQDLKRDSNVIQDIGKKQDNVIQDLGRQNSAIKEISNKNSMGVFTLIMHSAIAVALWLLTMLLIIIF